MPCSGRVMRTEVWLVVGKRDVLAAKPNVGRFAQRKDRVCLGKSSTTSCPLEEISNLTAHCQLGTPLRLPASKI